MIYQVDVENKKFTIYEANAVESQKLLQRYKDQGYEIADYANYRQTFRLTNRGGYDGQSFDIGEIERMQVTHLNEIQFLKDQVSTLTKENEMLLNRLNYIDLEINLLKSK